MVLQRVKERIQQPEVPVVGQPAARRIDGASEEVGIGPGVSELESGPAPQTSGETLESGSLPAVSGPDLTSTLGEVLPESGPARGNLETAEEGGEGAGCWSPAPAPEPEQGETARSPAEEPSQPSRPVQNVAMDAGSSGERDSSGTRSDWLQIGRAHV